MNWDLRGEATAIAIAINPRKINDRKSPNIFETIACAQLI